MAKSNRELAREQKKSREARTAAAIEAGFWFARDGLSWKVGRGFGADVVTLSSGHRTKADARFAMIDAWEAQSR